MPKHSFQHQGCVNESRQARTTLGALCTIVVAPLAPTEFPSRVTERTDTRMSLRAESAANMDPPFLVP
eukprot:10503546-Alexandrium_andersonii.AAC.1